ncbi:MAG: hypothetical protein ICV59_04545, partial [Thermoleophilia bacterium]|nr:hypothetical protein [Thermoleophilia bacterium]
MGPITQHAVTMISRTPPRLRAHPGGPSQRRPPHGTLARTGLRKGSIHGRGTRTNPFLATIGLSIDPAPNGSAIEFRLQVDLRTLPLYLYKTAESFTENMGQYVRQTLQEGLFGWQVTDCIVTMTKCAYSVPDGPPTRRGPLSTAADFRKLTPLVVMQALERAGTVVCEPIVRVSLEIPADAIGAVMAALARLGAAVETPSLQGKL